MNKIDALAKCETRLQTAQAAYDKEVSILRELPEDITFDLVVVQTGYLHLVINAKSLAEALKYESIGTPLFRILYKDGCTYTRPEELLIGKDRVRYDNIPEDKKSQCAPWSWSYGFAARGKESVDWYTRLDSGLILCIDVQIDPSHNGRYIGPVTSPGYRPHVRNSEKAKHVNWTVEHPRPPGYKVINLAGSDEWPGERRMLTECYDVGLEQFLGLGMGEQENV